MALVLVGLNHQTAPIDVRERFAFHAGKVTHVLASLREHPELAEPVLLSTCNRTEIYGRATSHPEAEKRLIQWLQSLSPGVPLARHLYVYQDFHTVHHLFRVAAGLDSMVVGEHEILSQVKSAYLTSQAAGLTQKLMNVLFQRSLYVGKRVRTETALSAGASSVGSLAVSMAERIFGRLSERTVMILGAGEMAETTARHLLSQKVHALFVANRTFERAQELAARLGGRALRYHEGLVEMAEADIILCSTSAPHPIVTPAMVEAIMPRRRDRSLFFIDISVPRNVHPDVHRLDNVYVYNIDDLQSIVNDNLAKRSTEVRRAETIVEAKAEEFRRWLAAYDAGQAHSFQHFSPGSADSL